MNDDEKTLIEKYIRTAMVLFIIDGFSIGCVVPAYVLIYESSQLWWIPILIGLCSCLVSRVIKFRTTKKIEALNGKEAVE